MITSRLYEMEGTTYEQVDEVRKGVAGVQTPDGLQAF